MQTRTTIHEAHGLRRPDVVASDRASWGARSMSDYDGEPVNRTDCKPWRDAETLRWAYHERDLSSIEVGSLLGTSKSTVLYWMEKHDVDRGPGPYREGPWREEETLRKAYVDEGKSMGGLAKDWDTSTATIYNWLNRHGIEHRHDYPEGEDHPLYIDGRSPGVGDTDGWDLPERECVRCGETYKPCDHRQEYCSPSCVHEKMRKRATVVCKVCGDGFEVPECEADRRVCCSYDCLAEHASERLTGARLGEDNPNWEGGYEPYYGRSWQQQREKALERDGHECVVCGDDDQVHVHHIRPFRTFGIENHEEANALDNLVCLCPTHHGRWEGIPLRPEVPDS